MPVRPDNRLQYDNASTLGNRAWGYIAGTYDKDAGPNNQRLYLNGSRVAQMSDTPAHRSQLSCFWHWAACERYRRYLHGHTDEFRIAHVQRSDGWIQTTWNNLSDPGAFAAAGAEEQEGGGGEPPPPTGTGVVVCLMA